MLNIAKGRLIYFLFDRNNYYNTYFNFSKYYDKTYFKGPIIFKQERVGKNKKIFYIYKLRTMTDCDDRASDRQVTVINDQRITRIGRILRKYKIDELPQLYNVLKGDMSFVGPRPEVKKYVKFYEEEYDEILKIKPGITDLASIEYIDENTIISKYSDPEKIYIEEVLPKN